MRKSLVRMGLGRSELGRYVIAAWLLSTVDNVDTVSKLVGDQLLYVLREAMLEVDDTNVLMVTECISTRLPTQMAAETVSAITVAGGGDNSQG